MVDETSDHPGNPEAAWFPPIVSDLGFNVSIENAKASRNSDHGNILSWVGDKVDEVNTILRRKCIRPAMYNAATTHGYPDLLRQIMECDLITKEEAVLMAEEEGCIPAPCEYVGKSLLTIWITKIVSSIS